jgi:FlaA1/EpsC-like NDP-sugar epimerase
MSLFPMSRRRLTLLMADVCAVALANLIAALLRFDFNWAELTLRQYRALELLILDLIITPIVFVAGGLYQGYLRYAGLDDLYRLTRAVALRTAVLVLCMYGLGFWGVSRAEILISTLVLTMLAGLLRLTPRFTSEFHTARRRSAAPRALIVGAGDTAEALIRELRKRPDAGVNPVALVDDDTEKRGIKIHGVPVLGTRQSLARVMESLEIREVIVAIPNLSSAAMREIFEVSKAAGARLRTVPTRGEIERGVARIGQIRAVEVEDLLGRDVVDLDRDIVRDSLRGRRVLITGAAGSIGREIAKQVLACDPEELVLLDRNENNLFYLEHDLRVHHPAARLTFMVTDVADRRQIEAIFRRHRPAVVLHAAAYKHVPLMEQNSVEAIKNNVLATRSLAEISAGSEVERFIYISTDKAVRPTSVMGATKRLGERMVKSLPRGRTRFMAVRFGNVLGSDGSVVPTFRRQIAAGGPVTVTHPETTRFFMTIQEAVQLVLTAGAMGDGGETFLLRMGEPVRIVDLARNLIELSGLQPDVDVRIVYTGLRPGEKLHEEVQASRESALPTSNEKIMVLTGVDPLDESGWRHLTSLETAVYEEAPDTALHLLRLLVPDYTPMGPLAEPHESAPLNIVDITSKKR